MSVEILCIAAEATAILLFIAVVGTKSASTAKNARAEEASRQKTLSPEDIAATRSASTFAILQLNYHVANLNSIVEETIDSMRATISSDLRRLRSLDPDFGSDSTSDIGKLSYLEETVQDWKGNSLTKSLPLAISLIQIDNYVATTEKSGTIATEHLVRYAAQCLSDQLGAHGVLCRYNLDTFAFAAVGLTNSLVSKLLQSINGFAKSNSFRFQDETITTSFSIAAMLDEPATVASDDDEPSAEKQNHFDQEQWETLIDGLAEVRAVGGAQVKLIDQVTNEWLSESDQVAYEVERGQEAKQPNESQGNSSTLTSEHVHAPSIETQRTDQIREDANKSSSSNDAQPTEPLALTETVNDEMIAALFAQAETSQPEENQLRTPHVQLEPDKDAAGDSDDIEALFASMNS